MTIEGDAGPAPVGSLAVVINGPYLPADSAVYNGMPDLRLRPALTGARAPHAGP